MQGAVTLVCKGLGVSTEQHDVTDAASEAAPAPGPRPGPVALREPAHRVCPRAVKYWRTTALIGDAILCIVLTVGVVVWPDRPWWALALLALVVVACVAHVALMPSVRFAVHRWEIDDEAIHTREGWLGRRTRIAPINRVQTVDFTQGPLMRAYGIASLTVTTASAAGSISITGLEAEQTRRLAAELTAITAADEGDAT